MPISVFRSGNGGTVEACVDGLGIFWFPLIDTVWELNEDTKLTENSHSGTGGSSNYEAVITENSWRLQIPWDEANIPESVGLAPKAKIGLRFKHGSGAIKKQLFNTSVEHFKTINDNQNDIVRVELDGKGGVKS